MAALSRGGSGRMYSWWWDSHISPKNSRWLQENLTDMDSKVKSMIKLIEEDADSFARRAEMYYKKRPELMKLVEEFYRAYRALAERYDHATGVIRQAQKTMVEAFPNQAPYILGDDSVGGSPGDPSAPDMSTPIRAFLEPDDLLKDGMGLPFLDLSDAKRNGTLTEESDSTVSRKGLKHPGDPSRLKDYAKFAEGRVRKGLKFDEPLGNERSVESDETHKDHIGTFASEQTDVSQEILLLKKALAEVKAQKDAGLIQYQQSLVKLSILESEVTRAQENSRGLSEQAAKAESEVQALKEALVKLEAEKEASLQQYRQYLNQISDMENSNARLQEETDQLMQRTTKAETEAQTLREEIGKVVAEKDTALNQYMGSLEMISNLQHKLQSCEDDAKNLKERAEKAENEVETLKQHISKLIEEKDAAVLKYEKCMITISSLEHELDSAREEANRLNVEIDNRAASLKNAEERCIELEKTNQTLHSEVEALMLKMGDQSQDLTEKHKELGRLWTCIQEERLRFVEAETAFQTLQHLHAQAQDELRRLASELQNKVQSLKNIETHNKGLEEQIMAVNEENKTLNELNTSSLLTIQQLGNEVSGLKETKGKLDEEVELRVDQRNALQQEIYCLKEELNVLNKQHSSIVEQVHAVGLSPEHLGSSVKELQDENTSLKETCLRETNEKVALLEKVLILDQLLEKNSVLETSLADLNAELEALREKIEALEESYKSLSEEKSVLFDEKASITAELKTANENLQKISEENAILENSLYDAHGEIQGLTTKSSTLEDSLKLLVNQKTIIASDRDSLTSELVSTQIRLDNLEKIYSELGEKYSALEDEKKASLCKIEELNIALDVEKKERAQFEQVNKLQLSKMENEMNLLLEELEHTKGEYDKEWQNAFESQTEIYMLRKCAQDLEEKNVDMLNKNHRLLETSESLAGLFAGLKQDYLNQEIEMKAVSQKASTLRMGVFDFFKAIDVDLDHEFVDRCEDHHLSCVLSKLGATQTSIHRSEEEKFLLSNELSVLVTLLQQLKIDAENLAVEKNVIDQEFRIRGDQLTMLQNENLKLGKTKEEMIAKVIERDHEKEESRIQMFDLQKKLTDLQRENIQGLEERGLMKEEILIMEEKISTLEEENHVLCMEVFSLEVLSVIFRTGVDEKSKELKALDEDLQQLDRDNLAIKQRLNLTERMLNDMLIQKGFQLQQLREEHEKAKLQSHSEREILVEEINTWEKEASKLFDEMQVSNFYKILYEQKLRELADACQRLDGENTSKESSINLLNETVGALTSQNGNINAQLAAYGPPIASLKQSILSLEKRSTLEPKDVGMHENTVISNEDSSVADPLSDLLDLERRIQSIEKAVVEREQLTTQESLNVHSELESAMKQIAELKSDSNLRRRRPISGMSELENSILTKDIMLDQVSESSPYGSSKREANINDSQILESWEIIDKEDGSIDLKMSNNPNKEISPVISKQSSFNRTRSLKKQRSNNRFGSDFMIEKELGVDKLDKLEISKRFVESSQPQEGQKKKVLERLNSDIQKLANLQITVEDLKRKLKIIRTSKKGKPMDECEILKEQLEEADANILKLFDQNAKLLKSVPPSIDAPEESGSVKARRNSEQARRMSEKIGRIQMEVQKIQFVILKLDIENDTKGKTKKAEARRRVLLKDYLYGGGVRSAYNKKKASFCCIRPQTEEN